MKYSVSKEFKNKEIVDGIIRYSNLQDCFDEIETGSIVYLNDEVYFGKVYLNVSDITIIGKDSSIIRYDAYNSLLVREEDKRYIKTETYGTTGSTTFILGPNAFNFKCFNVTIENSHERNKDVSNQAVAFKTESSNGYYENCRFISYQDTLYINEFDNIFKNCYITGDVDFIFGNGKAILDNCDIEINCILSDAYITAPNSFLVRELGFLFHKCNITIKGSNNAYLGRPWYSSNAAQIVMPSCLFYKCNFPSALKLEIIRMHKGHSDIHEMHYYKCLVDGSEKSSEISNENLNKYINFYESLVK